VLFLWAPLRTLDHALRPYQHIYFPLAYCLLYASWRFESLKWSIQRRDWETLVCKVLPAYIWYHCRRYFVH
jgi:hypothetical protein